MPVSAQHLAQSLSLPSRGVAAVLRLLDEQATVPFVARYRKEATGGLDEVQIRAIRDAAEAVKELDKRKASVLATIAGQDALTPELKRAIEAATTRQEVEDLYLPYKRKPTTRAARARARGLEPLARDILRQIDRGHPARVPADDLAGARDIVAEIVSEDVLVRRRAREIARRHGVVEAKEVKKGAATGTRFQQWADYREPVGRVRSHRWLAVARGEREKVLRVKVRLDADRFLEWMLRHFRQNRRSPWAEALADAVKDAWTRLVYPAVEREIRGEIAQRAEAEAVEVFARNLSALLLAPPFGARAVVGVDPGLRTGCKCVLLDATGRVVRHTTVYFVRSAAEAERGAREIVDLAREGGADAIAIGNGTGGRDAMRYLRTALKDAALDVPLVEVNEAGASVYSASDVAREELPGLDISVRGAVSIARRLQDPLAELVKIDAKAIGVGQYQHDVDQKDLARKLDEVVLDCVNRVGVELNTASPSLLAYVSGIGPRLAQQIVEHRARAPFRSRDELSKVAGVGPKTYEQAAGFLRLHGGRDPLDQTGVHPERAPLVRRIARHLHTDVSGLIGDEGALGRIHFADWVGEEVGEPTLRDIVRELREPGRDPRPPFAPPTRRDDVTTIEDLQVGMEIDGVVTNVTDFGAFVDLGVKQDGLVHVSKLSDRFVRDPHSIVAVGDRLPVRVLSVDRERRRISLEAVTASS